VKRQPVFYSQWTQMLLVLLQCKSRTIRIWFTFSSIIRQNTNTPFGRLFCPNRIQIEYSVQPFYEGKVSHQSAMPSQSSATVVQCSSSFPRFWAGSEQTLRVMDARPHLLHNLPLLSQLKLVLIYRPRRDGRLSRPSQLVTWRDTCPEMVTHPSTSLARCWLTLLIRPTSLATAHPTGTTYTYS